MVNFPSALDTFQNPTNADSLDTPLVVHHEQHTDANDAIAALEAKVGIDSSLDTNSLDYKINHLDYDDLTNNPIINVNDIDLDTLLAPGVYRLTGIASSTDAVWASDVNLYCIGLGVTLYVADDGGGDVTQYIFVGALITSLRSYVSSIWQPQVNLDVLTDLAGKEDIDNKVDARQGTPDNTHYPSEKLVKDNLNTKQDTLVSGSNIKTINGSSVLGSGDLTIGGSGGGFWTAITATYVSGTSCTVATDKTAIFKKGMVIKRQESGVDKVAMVSIPSTYGAPDTTITFIGDTMASIDTDTFKYCATEPTIARFAIAGTIGATGSDVANAWYANEPYRVIGAEIMAGVVAANSGNTIVDINGSTIGTLFTAKPTLAYNALTTATPFTADNAKSLALNERMTIDLDGVCTTSYHTDLYVNVYLFPNKHLFLT